MIDLAPRHKTGLALRSPVMVAAGCYGFGSAYRELIDASDLGAVIVGPVAARRTRGDDPPRMISFAGGVLLRTGLANPGLDRVVAESSPFWGQLPTAVIVHVPATTPDEVDSCCRRLSELDEVAGIELGLSDSGPDSELLECTRRAVRAAMQPVIVRLPLARAADLVEPAGDAGASALTIAGPPRGCLPEPIGGQLLTGDLHGPFLLPLVVRAVRSAVEHTRVPVIGNGGVWNTDHARTLLRAGCAAVQVGPAIWRDPDSASRIARELRPTT